MKHTIVDNYFLSDDEIVIVNSTIEIINKISKELYDAPRLSIDEQNVDPIVDKLMRSILNMELGKIYSVFNCLDDEARNKIKREIAE